EAEAGMGVVVPMMGRIQTWAVEPVATTAVAHVGQPVGHCPQQSRIERVTGSSRGCLTRGASPSGLCLTREQVAERFNRMVAVMQVDDLAEHIVTPRLGVTR